MAHPATAAASLSLDDAIAQARAIQNDLENGVLKVPYPPHVRQTLAECLTVFGAYATTSEKALELVRRLEGRELETVELPW